MHAPLCLTGATYHHNQRPQVSSLFQQAPGDDATANALRAGSVTVAQRFTAQLNSLIQTLQGSNVRFVRCIKSNHQLQPQRMDKYVRRGRLDQIGHDRFSVGASTNH